MSGYTILVADDDELLANALRRELEREGYQVFVAYDGEEALKLAYENQPNLLVLDVMMPKRQGWEVCREIRAESTIPILMLTARGEEMDRVLGLKLGADDYIVKPFSLLELLARIEANLRRVALDAEPELDTEDSTSITLGHLAIDPMRRTVTHHGQPVALTQKEFDLLMALLDTNGAVVKRDELLDQVWGSDWIGDTRTLDVHVRRLRNKLEDDATTPRLLLTVRGVGYRLVSVDELIKT